MGKKRIHYTPTRAPRGRVIHAMSLHETTVTACGKKMSGWLVSTQEELGCDNCKLALLRRAVEDDA